MVQYTMSSTDDPSRKTSGSVGRLRVSATGWRLPSNRN